MRMGQSDPGGQEAVRWFSLHYMWPQGEGVFGEASYDPFGGGMGDLVIFVFALTSINRGYIPCYRPLS